MKKVIILFLFLFMTHLFSTEIMGFKNKKIIKKELKEFKKWEKIIPQINNNIIGEKSIYLQIKKKIIKGKDVLYEFILIDKINILFYQIFVLVTSILVLTLIFYLLLKLVILKPKNKDNTEKKVYKSFLFIKILKEEYKSINFFELTINNVINKFNVKKIELPNGIIFFTMSAGKKESEFLKGVDIYSYILKRIKISGLVHSEDVKIINNSITDFYSLYSCIEFIETLNEPQIYTTEGSINDVKEDVALEKNKEVDLKNIIGKQNIYRIIL